ncbi:hypothetical protein K501DRAFT_256332 [Backusella circina FSU 941]|nr:hypothetical protein K501DRAFT_256332 [Backusella circina FSU 941]
MSSLEQILTFKKSCAFLLIQDSVRFSSLPFLVSLAQRAQSQDQHIIAVLTETAPSVWHSLVPNSHVSDAYSDPEGWNEKGETTENVTVISPLDDMERVILATVEEQTKKSPCLIVVDSIAPFIAISQHRTYQLLKTLYSFTTDQIRLVIGYHGDISYTNKTGLDFSASLHRLATAILKLEALREKTHFDTHAALTGFVPQDTFSYMQTPSNWMERGCLAHLTWRKKSGKVEYDTFGFQHDQIVPVTQLTGEIKKEEEEEKEEVEIKKVDPTANLSFNLNLTDEQRRAKENLVLPHYKAQQESTIYYDPDAADDFDDEDPDDDLDI